MPDAKDNTGADEEKTTRAGPRSTRPTWRLESPAGRGAKGFTPAGGQRPRERELTLDLSLMDFAIWMRRLIRLVVPGARHNVTFDVGL